MKSERNTVEHHEVGNVDSFHVLQRLKELSVTTLTAVSQKLKLSLLTLLSDETDTLDAYITVFAFIFVFALIFVFAFTFVFAFIFLFTLNKYQSRT